jgi:hypothetical protein
MFASFQDNKEDKVSKIAASMAAVFKLGGWAL